MQIRFYLAFSHTLIMAQDAPKRRFLSLIFLVSCISKSFLIRIIIIIIIIILLLLLLLLLAELRARGAP